MGVHATAADSFIASLQELAGRVQEEANYTRQDRIIPCIGHAHFCFCFCPTYISYADFSLKTKRVFCSPWPPIHGSLAAAVTALSTRLTTSKPSLAAVLGTPAGRQLARDLQRIYCQGSVLARYCSADAIAHQPSRAVHFLHGYCELTQAMPEFALTADCAPLERAAAYIDRALTEATQVEAAIAGAPSTKWCSYRTCCSVSPFGCGVACISTVGRGKG